MWIIYLNRFFKQFRRQDKAAGKGQFTRPSFPSHIPPCPHSSHKRPIDRKKPFLNTGKLTHLRISTVYNTDMLYNCFGLIYFAADYIWLVFIFLLLSYFKMATLSQGGISHCLVPFKRQRNKTVAYLNE